MKIDPVIGLALICLSLASCATTPKTNTQVAAESPQPLVKSTTNTYLVEMNDGIIVFRGFDQPWITTNYPGDKYRMYEGRGMNNESRGERIGTEARKTVSELREMVKTAKTAVLLKSLRTDQPDCDVDDAVAYCGNLIIAQELSRRRPLPDSLADTIEPSEVFVGGNGPFCPDLDSLLDYYARVQYK